MKEKIKIWIKAVTHNKCSIKQVFLNPNVRTRSQLNYEYDLIKSVGILILSDSPKAPDAMTMMNEMNFIF